MGCPLLLTLSPGSAMLLRKGAWRGKQMAADAFLIAMMVIFSVPFLIW